MTKFCGFEVTRMSTTTIIRQTLIESGPNPPNYGEGSNRTTPPNYGSLVEELKDARQHSTGRGQYLQNVCKILSNTGTMSAVVDSMLNVLYVGCFGPCFLVKNVLNGVSALCPKTRIFHF